MSIASTRTAPPWAADVAEPFRSDELFWRSVSASADALVTLVLAGIAASVVAFTAAGPLWCLLPFVLPAALLLRAGLAGAASARANRPKFAGAEDAAHAWRNAERTAVAAVFVKALLRNRLPQRPHGVGN